jgi:hypothetical protein
LIDPPLSGWVGGFATRIAAMMRKFNDRGIAEAAA